MHEEHMKKRRIYLVVAGIVLLALFGGVLWYVLFLKDTANELSPVTGDGGFGGVADIIDRGQNGSGGEINIPNTAGIFDDPNAPVFVQLTDVPVSGLYALETRTTVRYVEREKGDVYEIDGIDPSTKRKIGVNTIPGVQEAFFGNGGSTVVFRYLDFTRDTSGTISTTLGRISPSGDPSAPAEIDNTPLVNGISDVSISPNGTKLAFVVPLPDGGSSIRVMDLVDREPKEVLRSPLREWIPYMMDNGDVFLATKPSVYAPGYLYRYSPSTKTFERIVRNKMGMTALPSPDGSLALFSENTAQGPVFGIAGIQSGEFDYISGTETQLDISSLADKCVWHSDRSTAYCASFTPPNPRVEIPDAWYRGEVQLKDSFWKIDVPTQSTTLLGDPEIDIGKTIDATRLVISADKTILYFINRTDGTLWAMRIPKNKIRVNEDLNEATPEELRDIKGSTIDQ
jgi:hypothetical protein